MSLLYLNKEVRDEVDFLHADKHHYVHQIFVQGDAITIDGHDLTFPK